MWWRETDGRGHSDGFSAGFWLVTFWKNGFRSDCYLLRPSSETLEGVACSVLNVRSPLSLEVGRASQQDAG